MVYIDIQVYRSETEHVTVGSRISAFLKPKLEKTTLRSASKRRMGGRQRGHNRKDAKKPNAFKRTRRSLALGEMGPLLFLCCGGVLCAYFMILS
jgi:hypothetical protein